MGSVQLSGGYYVINGCQVKVEELAGIAASVFILFIACYLWNWKSGWIFKTSILEVQEMREVGNG